MATKQVVVGGGSLGVELARQIAGSGEAVRLVSRSNRTSGEIPGVVFVQADAREADTLTAATSGADVIYCTANVAYHRWPQELPVLWRGIFDAAAKARAHLVLATNLYAYGAPKGALTEASEVRPNTRKGRVRAELEREAIARAEAGEFRLSVVRASDFYGPAVKDAIFGDRFLPPLLAGKPGQLFGTRTARHSYSYVPDFAATLVAAGRRDPEAPETWLVPNDRPVTIPELETLIAALLAERGLPPSARITTVGAGALRLAGLFMPAAGEVVEMLYEWNRDFVTDSSRTQTVLGLSPTPLEDGLRAAIAWYASGMRSAA